MIITISTAGKIAIATSAIRQSRLNIATSIAPISAALRSTVATTVTYRSRNDFRIVGHPRDKLPNRLGIKLAERLMQGGIHYIATQLLDDADRGAVKRSSDWL